jgi:hypothetical protein
MKRIVWAVTAIVLLVFAGAAHARPSGSERITTTLFFPTFPSEPPYFASYSGVFEAAGAVSDSGDVSAQALLAAVASPSTGVLKTVRTLTGNKGTLTLSCTQRIFPPNQTPVDNTVSNTGTCVVLAATGAYSGLRGSGKLTGTTDFGAPVVTVIDELVL